MRKYENEYHRTVPPSTDCCTLEKIIMDENLMAINVYCFLDILHNTLSLGAQNGPWCIVEPSVVGLTCRAMDEAMKGYMNV